MPKPLKLRLGQTILSLAVSPGAKPARRGLPAETKRPCVQVHRQLNIRLRRSDHVIDLRGVSPSSER